MSTLSSELQRKSSNTESVSNEVSIQMFGDLFRNQDGLFLDFHTYQYENVNSKEKK
jgi:hypothetical protein